MSMKPAGTYVLDEFSIESLTSDTSQQSFDPRTGFSTGSASPVQVDLKSIVHVWNIQESMLNGSVRGSATIYDAVGAFYDMPMRGQEILRVRYTDLKGVSKEHKFFVYSITDVKPSKSTDDAVLEYKLNFVSFGKFWSDRYSIQRCIAEGSGTGRRYIPIHEQVQVLFDDYYSSPGGTQKQIEISETDGEQKLVIPNLKPEDAMHFFSRRGFSATYKSSNYRFFESRDKYHFANVEELVAFAPADQSFYFASGPADQTPEAELAKLQSVIEVDYGQTVNTIDAMNEGAYYRKFTGLDPLTRTQSVSSYQHKTSYVESTYPDGEGTKLNLQASDEMIDLHMNKWRNVYGIKDYADPDVNSAYGLRPQTHYGDIYNNKTASMYHYEQSKITIQIFGTNEVVVGSVIQLELPEFRVQLEQDTQRSGKWLVESISNEFVENSYYQTLTLVKGGLLDG